MVGHNALSNDIQLNYAPLEGRLPPKLAIELVSLA
jgi:hypothetical protein